MAKPDSHEFFGFHPEVLSQAVGKSKILAEVVLRLETEVLQFKTLRGDPFNYFEYVNVSLR